MEVIYPCGGGLDVHKKSITACILWAEAKRKSRKQKKRFGTLTHDLLQLADWLAECGVTHVAMESTGVTEHHRFLLQQLYDHLRFTESKRSEIEQEIDRRMRPFEDKVIRLCTIPGVDRVTAWGMLAEIGMNMNQFPSSGHLASWACLCPGSFESAGKRLSGKMRKGNVSLRRCLWQAAWAISMVKNNYLSARYRRIAARRGAKRAVMAVAHVLLATK